MTEATDSGLAAQLADEAGRRLLQLRASWGGAQPAELGARGDAVAHQVLVDGLASARPGDAVLSEEAPDDPARLKARRVWIIDPLDGTREFAEPGRDDWAVHVALVIDGNLTTGAVALPARGITLRTDAPPPLPTPGGPSVRMLVSRTRPPTVALDVARQLGAEVIPMGSAGAKAMAVVLGEGDVYLHAGGQYEWDSAAPVSVAMAAGLHASRLDGSPLRYNQPNPWLPDLLLCHIEMAGSILAMAGAAMTTERRES